MNGRKWTTGDDAMLQAEYNRIPLADLAKKLGRRECAVRARALGFRIPAQVIEFDCAMCGKHVVTEGQRENGRNDRRIRFCSPECEKKYWRHPPSDHETSSTNFRNAAEYLAWEKKTNE